MKPYRDEEGHWAIDSNPYRAFEQYAKERDFVEVVRCKDCQYYFEQPRGFSPICELTRSRAEEEGFCAWGKKKDE